MKRETVGKLSSELLQKETSTYSPIDLEREMHAEYDSNIMQCIDSGKKQYPHNFYVVVITKRERLMPNVFRNYFFPRETCPTPDWDQAVYHYMRSVDAVEFLWVVPSKQTCEYLREHALEVSSAEKELLNFVLDFSDGTLLRRSKKLNKEKEDSPLIDS